MLIGAHVSVAGGLDKAINRGENIGAQIVQTFASSPRSIKYTPYDDGVIELYKEKRSASSVEEHVFHGVYLINLAHEDPDYVQACVDSLIYYQTLASEIDGMGTVFHIGSHKGKGFKAVLSQVADAIVNVLNATPKGVSLMLENAAGHAGTIGQSMEELEALYEAVSALSTESDKLGLCLDTQHLYASGIDVREPEKVDELLGAVKQTFGKEALRMIHINDSKTPLASNTDRHANLGEGEIGKGALSYLVNHSALSDVPFVLEVPGENKSGPRKQDVTQLKSLIKA